MTNKQKEFARKIYAAALCTKDGISPVFTTAQAILESAWGNSGIGNNLFGITKGSSWTGKTQLVLTTEFFKTPSKTFSYPEKVVSITREGDRYKYRVYRLFRDYATISACLDDHARILRSPGYADAWPYRADAIEFARRISDNVLAKYATAPHYFDVMQKLIGQINDLKKAEQW